MKAQKVCTEHFRSCDLLSISFLLLIALEKRYACKRCSLLCERVHDNLIRLNTLGDICRWCVMCDRDD